MKPLSEIGAMLAAITLAPAFAAPAMAGLDLIAATYICERGVEVPVTYVNETGGEGQSIAVLTVEGRQVSLFVEISGSGARYGWPSDGSSYVWWTKGDTATLYWKDGETATEIPLLNDCKTTD